MSRAVSPTPSAATAGSTATAAGAAEDPPATSTRPLALVVVDEDLAWVVPLPQVPLGSCLPASPGSLARFMGGFARELAVSEGALRNAAGDDGCGRPADGAELPPVDPRVVDAAARVIAAYLEDLPDLPLSGAPFGGEEGTD